MKTLKMKKFKLGITESPDPGEVLLFLRDNKKVNIASKIKKGTKVQTGGEILTGFYSPVTGEILGLENTPWVNEKVATLKIQVDEEEVFDTSLKSVTDFLSVDPPELLKKLNRLNLGFKDPLPNVSTLIIGGVDDEPGTYVNQQLLEENLDHVPEAIKLFRHLTGANTVILAAFDFIAEEIRKKLDPEVRILSVVSVYPHSLPQMIQKKIDPEVPKDCLFVKFEKVLAALHAIKDGKPFVHKVITLKDPHGIKNIRVRLGTPIRNLLNHRPGENEKIILGGPMRGTASFHLDVPVDRWVDALYVQNGEEVKYMANRQCFGCGSCVAVCPVNLDVWMISRFSEFAFFDRCMELGVSACFECGMCAYVCPSGRSLVQLVQLAKRENEKKENKEAS